MLQISKGSDRVKISTASAVWEWKTTQQVIGFGCTCLTLPTHTYTHAHILVLHLHFETKQHHHAGRNSLSLNYTERPFTSLRINIYRPALWLATSANCPPSLGPASPRDHLGEQWPFQESHTHTQTHTHIHIETLQTYSLGDQAGSGTQCPRRGVGGCWGRGSR